MTYMDESLRCDHCETDMTRAALIDHECDGLRDSRERGRKFLETYNAVALAAEMAGDIS